MRSWEAGGQHQIGPRGYVRCERAPVRGPVALLGFADVNVFLAQRPRLPWLVHRGQLQGLPSGLPALATVTPILTEAKAEYEKLK